MIGAPSLGPAFYVPSAPAVALLCIATLVASAIACAVNALAFVCSVIIFAYMFVCFSNFGVWVCIDETAVFY